MEDWPKRSNSIGSRKSYEDLQACTEEDALSLALAESKMTFEAEQRRKSEVEAVLPRFLEKVGKPKNSSPCLLGEEAEEKDKAASSAMSIDQLVQLNDDDFSEAIDSRQSSRNKNASSFSSESISHPYRNSQSQSYLQQPTHSSFITTVQTGTTPFFLTANPMPYYQNNLQQNPMACHAQPIPQQPVFLEEPMSLQRSPPKEATPLDPFADLKPPEPIALSSGLHSRTSSTTPPLVMHKNNHSDDTEDPFADNYTPPAMAAEFIPMPLAPGQAPVNYASVSADPSASAAKPVQPNNLTPNFSNL